MLTGVYTEAFTLGTLPDTFNEALLTLILKRDKEPTELRRFRPVTLIDVDNNRFTSGPQLFLLVQGRGKAGDSSNSAQLMQ